MMPKSVSARFMLLMLPLMGLCFVLISGVTYYMASDSLSRSSVMLTRCISTEAALRMQISVADIHLPLKMAAAHPEAFLSGDEERIIQELNALKKTSPLIGQMLYAFPDGQTIRADGKHLDRGSRSYFRHVLRTKQPYISKPFLGETTQKMQTMVLQPIFDGDELKGVLFASVHLSTLIGDVMAHYFFPDEEIYITDGDGEPVGCSNHPDMRGHAKLVGDGAADVRLEYALRTAIATEEQTFTPFLAPDGRERFAAVTPISLSGNQWAVIASYSLDRVNAEIRRLLGAMAGVFLVAMMVAALIVRLFAKTIAAPLRKIAHEVRSIGGQGIADGGDELGTLAEGVEHMRSMQDKSQQLEQKASSDELTGLLNRFGFRRKVREEIAAHEGRPAILVFADLDHLKHINDEIGHAAGDDALAAAAWLLRHGFGENAVIGRVGGDEFVIFQCAEQGSGTDALERTRALLREYNEHSGKPYYVEFSMGTASFVCAPDTDISALLRKADECLYDAKRKRRDTSIRKE